MFVVNLTGTTLHSTAAILVSWDSNYTEVAESIRGIWNFRPYISYLGYRLDVFTFPAFLLNAMAYVSSPWHSATPENSMVAPATLLVSWVVPTIPPLHLHTPGGVCSSGNSGNLGEYQNSQKWDDEDPAQERVSPEEFDEYLSTADAYITGDDLSPPLVGPARKGVEPVRKVAIFFRIERIEPLEYERFLEDKTIGHTVKATLESRHPELKCGPYRLVTEGGNYVKLSDWCSKYENLCINVVPLRPLPGGGR